MKVVVTVRHSTENVLITIVDFCKILAISKTWICKSNRHTYLHTNTLTSIKICRGYWQNPHRRFSPRKVSAMSWKSFWSRLAIFPFIYISPASAYIVINKKTFYYSQDDQNNAKPSYNSVTLLEVEISDVAEQVRITLPWRYYGRAIINY